MIYRDIKEVHCRRLSLIDRRDWLLAATSDPLAGDRLASLVLTAAMSSQCLVRQIHPLPLLGLLRKFLLLQPRRPLPTVEAADHVGRAALALVEKVLVGPERLLREQVVGSCYLIVPVGLDAFYRVVGIVIKFIEHHLIQFIVHRHWLLAGK
jgi:hypothetical protein